MSDFDTRRVGEIAILEATIRNLQGQVSELRKSSDKWEPRASSEIEGDRKNGRITLAFGGRTLAVLLPLENLQNGDTTSNTTSALNAFCGSLISDQLRPVLTPHVDKLVKNAMSFKQVGNW